MRVLKALFEGTVLATAIIAVIAIGVGIGIPLGNLFIQPKVEEVVEESDTLAGVAPSTLSDIVGIFPTTTSISLNNTEYYSTSTPTSTDYISIGPLVKQLTLFMIAQSTTSAEYNDFLISTSIAPNSAGSTDTKNYFAIVTGSISGAARTWTVATTTGRLTLPGTGYSNVAVPICNSNYDGTDDVPECIAGSYRIDIGRVDFSNVEIYAGINRN